MPDLTNDLNRVPFGTPHPEARADETFIAYERAADTADMCLPGKRLGTQVFDASGADRTEEAAAEGIVPVFANTVENNKRYSGLQAQAAAARA
ncbi:MAG TPA: hypothetical protein VGB97_04375 [Candidatus Paceibacterota bacterium]|jgi:hypothetical protein